ncbi:MAG TPA: RNA polymerase sigma factor [Candidatus Limnocylindrales bacterium]|jgi:RNA polymerase sigma-70 factor (ECF subfamily)|nr:RNA polymerase sigma factor [Candidatus Limnocylindrales bacterium]
MQRDLADRARRGDHDAFDALAAASIGRLYSIACLILRDRDRAEDATQDALVQAWRDIRGVRNLDSVDAWLNRLLVRACYHQARRERRRALVELRVVERAEPVQANHELSVAQRDQLERGFARLDLDQRSILVLHHYIGLPLTEVATILDIPIGTAKSRLHRGIAAMRSALEADDRDLLARKGRTA